MTMREDTVEAMQELGYPSHRIRTYKAITDLKQTHLTDYE